MEKRKRPDCKKFNGLTAREIVKEYFPAFSSREIADKFGCSDSYIRTLAREMGIKHNEETLKRIKVFRVSRHSYGPMSEEEKNLWIEKRKKTYRVEKWRQENGLPRRTKLRISPLNKAQKTIKYSLCAKRHYFSNCNVDPFALFYDEETKRNSPSYHHQEDYYERKYGFRFVPADGYEEEYVNDKNVEYE